MTHDHLDSPVLVRLADVEPESVRWLWPGRLPRGRLALLAGMPGLGKSFATCDFASRVSTGTPWPDGSACDPGSVLLVTAEDDAGDTIRPRLDAHGADVSKIHLLQGVHRLDRRGKPVEAPFMLENLEPLEQALDTLSNVRLVVVDPVGSFMGARIDSRSDTEVRSVLGPLATLANRADAAVLLIAHVRKATAQHADDLVLGSRAYTGLARAVLHLFTDPDDQQRRLLLPGKMNLTAPPPGLSYTITGDPTRVVWSDSPTTWTATDVLAATGGRGRQDDDDEPAQWLRDVLSSGPIPSSEVKELGETDGFKWRTVQAAKSRIGAIATREGFDSGARWVWHLPEERSDPP